MIKSKSPNLLVDCEPARVRCLAAVWRVLATRRIDGDCSRNPTRHSARLRAKPPVTIPRQTADRRVYAQALARNHAAPPTACGQKCFVIARFWPGGSSRTRMDTRQARVYPLTAGPSGSSPPAPRDSSRADTSSSCGRPDVPAVPARCGCRTRLPATPWQSGIIPRPGLCRATWDISWLQASNCCLKTT